MQTETLISVLFSLRIILYSGFTVPRLWIQLLAIITLTIGVYQFAPQASFMPVDDSMLSFRNPIVTEFDLKGAFSTYDPELYIPFTLLSYQIEYFFFGDDPMVYHVVNLVIHIFNALAVFFLVRFFTYRWQVPLLTAILFAVHPINTEAVLWVSGRKDLLSAFFFLTSLIAYCQYRLRGTRVPYYSCLALFICGLFSKVIVVTVPLMFLIIDDLIPTKKRPFEQLAKWPFYSLSILFLGLAMLRKFISVYSVTYLESALLAAKGVVFYLRQMIVPHHLSMFYRQVTPIEFGAVEFLFPLIILLCLAYTILASRMLGKLYAFGMMWFGITLLPNLANASKGGKAELFYASDRYVYLACIGIFFLLSLGLLWAYDNRGKVHRYIAAGIVMAVPCAYALHAHMYSAKWLYPKTYMQYVVHHYPETPVAHTLIGLSELEEGNSQKAFKHFSIAVNQSPKFRVPLAHKGFLLLKEGRVEEGMEILEGIQGMREETEYIFTYRAFGHVLQKQYGIAEGLLGQVLSVLPNDSKALQMMGTIRAKQGRYEDAEQYYRQAIAAHPASIRPKVALVQLLNFLK